MTDLTKRWLRSHRNKMKSNVRPERSIPNLGKQNETKQFIQCQKNNKSPSPTSPHK